MSGQSHALSHCALAFVALTAMVGCTNKTSVTDTLSTSRSTSSASTVATSAPPPSATLPASAAPPAVHPPSMMVRGAQNTGCIDARGTLVGRPGDWYTDRALGEVVLDIGELKRDSDAAVALSDALVSFDDNYSLQTTWEFTSREDPACIIGRGASVVASDGAQLRVSIWRLTASAQLSSIPSHAAFVAVEPDLFVSDAPSAGDVTVLKVLEDGTTVKVVALGRAALGFAGWPTTIAPPIDAPPPEVPQQSIEDLSRLAADVASMVAR